MADIVDTATRSRMMSGIRGKNTRPELLIRKGLFAMGFRYRLHAKELPGKPDLILPRYRAAIFIHGCFWHGHGCHLFRIPSSNIPFWTAKIAANQLKDILSKDQLLREGWRVAVVWECALKGRERKPLDTLLSEIAEWLHSPVDVFVEISGLPLLKKLNSQTAPE